MGRQNAMAPVAMMLAVFALLSGGGWLAAAEEENPYLTKKDFEVLNDADTAAITYCEDVVLLNNEDRDDARQELLDSIGGKNIIEDVLTTSKDQDEMQEKLQEELTPGEMLANAAPLVMALVMLILWFFFCWTACRCCRCCRCCSKPKRCPMQMRLLVPLCVFVIGIGAIACVGLAGSAHSKTSESLTGGACAAANMLNTTLGGRKGAKPFIGMVGVMNTFWALDQTLEDDSDFLTELTALLDESKPIEEASKVASGVMGLISDSMSVSANMAPKAANGEDLMHKCEFCAQAGPLMGEVAQALDGGVATALTKARDEVGTQFNTEARKELQNTMREATQPLINFKDTLRDTFSPFTDTDSFAEIQGIVDVYLLAGMLSIFFLCFFLLCCAGTSAGCFALKDKKAEAEEEAAPADPSASGTPQRPKNPYNKTVTRCGCCMWYCGFFYCALAFFLGGLIQAITWPVASVCLIMDTANGDLLTDIGGSLGQNFSGDNGDMMVNMFDQCIANADPNANANMFDIVFTRDVNTSEKVYMRQRLLGMLREPIDAQFRAINESVANSSVTISDNPGVVQLRGVFRDTPISGMILADREKMIQDSTLSGLAADSRDPGVKVGFVTSARCADTVLTGAFGEGGAPPSPGIDGFVAELEFFGGALADASCAKEVSCPAGPGPDASACSAGNAYIRMKRKVLDSTTYRCDLFEDPADPTAFCDPKNMALVGGVWTNDCLKADGSMTPKLRLCSLTDFENYVKDHDLRLERIFDRLDVAVDATFGTILSGLQELVNKHVINHVVDMTDLMTCGFIGDVYRGIVDSFCFQGVVGFRRLGNSYVGSAAVMIMLMAVIYGTWRNQIDSWNAWKDEHPTASQVAPMDQVVPMDPAKDVE